MIIKVTQEHINKGKQCMAAECPVALALMEAFNVRYACATPTILYVGTSIYSNGIIMDAREFKTPAIVEAFMHAFDDVKSVPPFQPKPFEFEL